MPRGAESLRAIGGNAPMSLVTWLRLGAIIGCLALVGGWMLENALSPLGGSLGRTRLALGFSLAAGLAVDRWCRDPLVMRSWAWPLLAFLLLFSVRWLIDLGDAAAFKAATVATSGGVFLFLGLGVAVGVACEALAGISSGGSRSGAVVAALWSLAVASGAVWLLVEIGQARASAEPGQVLLSLQGRYQRAGNMLIMAVLLVLVVNFSLNRSIASFGAPRARLAIASLHAGGLVLAAAAATTAQILGSNIGTATVLLAATASLAMLASGWMRRRLAARPSRSVRGLLSVTAATLAIAVGGAAALVAFSIDPSRLRITGFGSGRVDSLESRWALWANFPIHFAESPLLGSMTVDARTTGPGSYVHSFAAMLLTHTGVVGFLLMAAVLLLALWWLLRRGRRTDLGVPPGRSRSDRAHGAVLLCVVGGMACVGTGILWAPFWFTLGLLAPPVAFEPRAPGLHRPPGTAPPRRGRR